VKTPRLPFKREYALWPASGVDGELGGDVFRVTQQWVGSRVRTPTAWPPYADVDDFHHGGSHVRFVDPAHNDSGYALVHVGGEVPPGKSLRGVQRLGFGCGESPSIPRQLALERKGKITDDFFHEWREAIAVIYEGSDGGETHANISAELLYRTLSGRPMPAESKLATKFHIAQPTVSKHIWRIVAAALFDMPADFVVPLHFATARYLATRVINEHRHVLGAWRTRISQVADAIAQRGLEPLVASRWMIVASWTVSAPFLQLEDADRETFAADIRSVDPIRYAKGFSGSAVSKILEDLTRSAAGVPAILSDADARLWIVLDSQVPAEFSGEWDTGSRLIRDAMGDNGVLQDFSSLLLFRALTVAGPLDIAGLAGVRGLEVEEAEDTAYAVLALGLFKPGPDWGTMFCYQTALALAAPIAAADRLDEWRRRMMTAAFAVFRLKRAGEVTDLAAADRALIVAGWTIAKQLVTPAVEFDDWLDSVAQAAFDDLVLIRGSAGEIRDWLAQPHGVEEAVLGDADVV
jgi:hypothetical protein